MLKTNKEIEDDIMERPNLTPIAKGDMIKLITQTRIADLEEIERIIEEAVKEELAAKPKSHLEEVAEWYKINGFNLLKSKIQKVKEEIIQ